MTTRRTDLPRHAQTSLGLALLLAVGGAGCLEPLAPDSADPEAAATSGAQEKEMEYVGTGIAIDFNVCRDTCCVAKEFPFSGSFTVDSVGPVDNNGVKAVVLRVDHAWHEDLPARVTHLVPDEHRTAEWNAGVRRGLEAMNGLQPGDQLGILYRELPTAPEDPTLRLWEAQDRLPRRLDLFLPGDHGGFTNGHFFEHEAMSLEAIGALFRTASDALVAEGSCDHVSVDAYPAPPPSSERPATEYLPQPEGWEIDLDAPFPDEG